MDTTTTNELIRELTQLPNCAVRDEAETLTRFQDSQTS
jgi:hypothetical protein